MKGSVAELPCNKSRAQFGKPSDLNRKTPCWITPHGLVLQSRVQPKQAVLCFEAALKRQPAYLPAWQALLRTRLIRKDLKSLQSESLELARLAKSEEAAWPEDSERQQAAFWLGKIVGYLSLPEVDLLKDADRKRFESDLKTRLGTPLAAAFAAGQTALQTDYQKLRQDLAKDIQQEAKHQEKKAGDDLANLADKGQNLDKKTETLKLTAEQWKDQIEQQMKKTDQQLKVLEAEYKTLSQALQGVSKLVLQTQIDIGRVRTTLELGGMRGVRLDQHPAMLQRRQELLKYENQFLSLQQRGATVISQGRQLLTTRTVAVQKYQQATGNIVRQTETLTRWKKNVEETSKQIANQGQAKTKPGLSLEKRLSLATSYFELDEKAELTRLIQQAGGTVNVP